jgi:membrane protein
MKAYRFPLLFPAFFKKIRDDNALFLARGLAFDVLVCLIPATFLLLVLFGFIFDSPREAAHYMRTYMKSMLPFSSQEVMRGLFSVVRTKKVLGVVGLLGLVWTLSRVFGSIRTVLDVIFQVRGGRGILRGKLFDLKMMFLSTLFFLATVLVTSIFSILKKISAQPLAMKFQYLGARWEVASILLAFFFTVCLFFCLYKYVPFRKIRTSTALFAALGAGILWELAKHGFRFYLLKFADVSEVYGPFGLLFALVLWVYYSCIVFILGAEMGWVWEKKR